VLRGPEKDAAPPRRKKALLPAGDHPFAAPHYWAAFVLIGDPF
jgi:CHAT domain-containing protein